MNKDEEYVKTTIKIARDTWIKIGKLQQSRHVRSMQHAVVKLSLPLSSEVPALMALCLELASKSTYRGNATVAKIPVPVQQE